MQPVGLPTMSADRIPDVCSFMQQLFSYDYDPALTADGSAPSRSRTRVFVPASGEPGTSTAHGSSHMTLDPKIVSCAIQRFFADVLQGEPLRFETSERRSFSFPGTQNVLSPFVTYGLP